MKKYIKFLVVLIFVMSAIWLAGCSCGPKQYSLRINFIDADEELGLKSYTKEVGFGVPIEIEFELPEGYDHTQIITNFAGENIPIEQWTVDFESLDEDTEYMYSVGKTLKYKIDYISEDSVFNINMSAASKKTFEIELDEKYKENYIIGVAIDKNSLTDLKVLDENNSKVLQKADNKILAKYGDYVALIYNRTFDKFGRPKNAFSAEISSLYSDVNHFTEKRFIKQEGLLNYSEFVVSTRGLTKYHYAKNVNNHIFYIGQVKEDMKIYSSIPNFEEKLGFDLKEDYNTEIPNTFYLLNNSNDYNQINKLIDGNTSISITQPISTQLFGVKSSFSGGETDTIGVDGQQVVIEEITPSKTRLYNRYDSYQLYIGDDYNHDLLLGSEKNNIYENLYLKVNLGKELYDSVWQHIYNLKYKALENEAKLKGYVFDTEAAHTISKNLADSTYIKRTQSVLKYQILPYEEFNIDLKNDPYMISLLNDSTGEKIEETGNYAPSIVSTKGNYYIKISKEMLEPLILSRTELDESTNLPYDYKTGTGILYVSFQTNGYDDIDNIKCPSYTEIDYDKETSVGIKTSTQRVYATVVLYADFVTDIVISPFDYQIVAFVDYKGADNKMHRDFGFVDYFALENSFMVTVYFKNSLIVNSQDCFIDNFYVYVVGTNYENFRTPKINSILYLGENSTPLDDVKDAVSAGTYTITEENQDHIEVSKIYHGISKFQYNFTDKVITDPAVEKDINDYYVCTLNIKMQTMLASNYEINFEHCEMFNDFSNSIRVTNSYNFEGEKDFSMINGSKVNEEHLAILGATADLYYFVESNDDNVDFDIYLDPTNKNTCITTTKVLTDILGNVIKIDLNFGKPREVRVKYLTPVFETLAPIDGYYFFAC